jgi:lipoprotein-anchoring transpeptidase ErfK/SrfK
MMIRPFAAVLLGLATAMTVVPAVAQSRGPGPVYRPAPPPDVVFDDDDDAQGMYRPLPPGMAPNRAAPMPLNPNSDQVDAAPLPPPGAGVPYGRSYDRRQPGPPPAAQSDPDVIRPPAPIGAAPAAPAAPGAVPQPVPPSATAALPPEDQPEVGAPKELPQNLRKQLVDFATKEPAGTIVIDTPHTYLYLTLGNGKAIRYGIGVGREGFTWAGTERVSKMKEWPDWFPPAEMIERQPYLPRVMAGGPGNPLGARALYLGNTLYRIHGTNQPSTIGSFVSSGCIRLLNEDIEDLFDRVQVGTRVVVLPGGKPPDATAANAAAPKPGTVPPGAPPQPPNNAAVNAAPLPPIR